MDKPQDKDRMHLSRAQRERRFLYRQLADIIAKQIEEGHYQAGERLPSMDTIAAKYAVNKVTVRRAFNELANRGLIYSVPAQGTYVAERRSRAARPRGEGQLLTIGLISHVMVPGNTGLYHMEIIEGIRAELSRVNGSLVILPVRYVEPQIKILNMVLQSNLDGAIYLGGFDPTALTTMIEQGPPAALLDYQLRSVPVDTVVLDNRAGGYQAMEHLISLGHRTFAVVTGETDLPVSQERLSGVYEALDHFDIPHSQMTVIPGDFQREGGYEAMRKVLKMAEPPTAVFFMNDEMAAGGIQAVYTESSLKVPDNISIVGFDDTSWATATQPPLTTIRVDKGLMGSIAVQRIAQRISNPSHPPTTTLIPPRLVVRESTAPPRR